MADSAKGDVLFLDQNYNRSEATGEDEDDDEQETELTPEQSEFLKLFLEQTKALNATHLKICEELGKIDCRLALGNRTAEQLKRNAADIENTAEIINELHAQSIYLDKLFTEKFPSLEVASPVRKKDLLDKTQEKAMQKGTTLRDQYTDILNNILARFTILNDLVEHVFRPDNGTVYAKDIKNYLQTLNDYTQTFSDHFAKFAKSTMEQYSSSLN